MGQAKATSAFAEQDEAGTWIVTDHNTEGPLQVQDRMLSGLTRGEAEDAVRMLQMISGLRAEPHAVQAGVQFDVPLLRPRS